MQNLCAISSEITYIDYSMKIDVTCVWCLLQDIIIGPVGVSPYMLSLHTTGADWGQDTRITF